MIASDAPDEGVLLSMTHDPTLCPRADGRTFVILVVFGVTWCNGNSHRILAAQINVLPSTGSLMRGDCV